MDQRPTKKFICMGKSVWKYEKSTLGMPVPVFTNPEICVLVETVHATNLGEKSIFRVPVLEKEYIGTQKQLVADIWNAFMSFPRTDKRQLGVTSAGNDEERFVVVGSPLLNLKAEVKHE